MYCRRCGEDNEDNAYRCVRCGEVVQGVAPQPAQLPNYLVQAILVTIFCCIPLGIPATVFAAQVNGKCSAGDYAGALESSRKARAFCWWAFGVGLVVNVLFVMASLVS